MYFDKTHNLKATFYTFLPFGIKAGMTYSFESGDPYTPMRWNGDKPEEDLRNKFAKRAHNKIEIDLALSKSIEINNMSVRLGLDIYNLLDARNTIDVYPLTGNADDPGTYYTENVGLPYLVPDGESAKSSLYYDRSWMYQSPREINFLIRFDFN